MRGRPHKTRSTALGAATDGRWWRRELDGACAGSLKRRFDLVSRDRPSLADNAWRRHCCCDGRGRGNCCWNGGGLSTLRKARVDLAGRRVTRMTSRASSERATRRGRWHGRWNGESRGRGGVDGRWTHLWAWHGNGRWCWCVCGGCGSSDGWRWCARLGAWHGDGHGRWRGRDDG